MRVVYYRKEKDSKINYYSNYSTDYFYLPELELLLCKHTPAIWGGIEFKMSSDPQLLSEAATLIQGRPPSDNDRIIFSRPKRFIYDQAKINEIIDSKDKAKLEQGIEELLKMVE